jgi:GT2 family glycosyltransferase
MNRHDEIAKCLMSLRNQLYPAKQVIVVDNGSTDCTIAMLRSDVPEVEIVSLEVNEGVAGGRNHGVAAAKGDICIFLDDDARLPFAKATTRALRYFEEKADLGVLTFKVVDEPSGKEVQQSIPRADKKRINGDYFCASFCGGACAIHRRAFLELGGYWEDLFYGGEELDYAYRVLNAGLHILRTDSIVVIHHSVSTARPPGQAIYYSTRNRAWIALRHLPWPHVLSTMLFWWGYNFFQSAKTNQLNFFWRGVQDSISRLPHALGKRQVISNQALQVLRSDSGRLWY